MLPQRFRAWKRLGNTKRNAFHAQPSSINRAFKTGSDKSGKLTCGTDGGARPEKNVPPRSMVRGTRGWGSTGFRPIDFRTLYVRRVPRA